LIGKLLPLYSQSFFCPAGFTSQHYHWYAATWFAFQRVASWVDYSRQITESCQLPQLAKGWCTMMWKINSHACDSKPRPVDPNASVLSTTPQRSTVNVCTKNQALKITVVGDTELWGQSHHHHHHHVYCTSDISTQKTSHKQVSNVRQRIIDLYVHNTNWIQSKWVKLRKFYRLNHRMTKILMTDNRKKNIHNCTEYKQHMLHKLDI